MASTDPRKLVRRLYRDVDGFAIPKAETVAVKKSRGSPVYGELTPTGVARMLEYLEMEEADVFYDLGSGSGKVVLQTAMTAPVRKCVGVELASTRVRQARAVLRKARRDRLLRAAACGFREADLLTTYLSDASVIYTCSTAFTFRFMDALVARVRALSRELLFVTLQEIIKPPPLFEHIDTLRLDTTWTRRARVSVYLVSKP